MIEDCAQAHGARYKGRSVGSIGHVGARELWHQLAQWTAARTANAAVLAQALQPFAGPGGVVRLPAFRCGSSCTAGGTGACSAAPHADAG